MVQHDRLLDLEVGQKYLKPPRMIQYRLGKEKGRKASNLCCILQVCLQDLRQASFKQEAGKVWDANSPGAHWPLFPPSGGSHKIRQGKGMIEAFFFWHPFLSLHCSYLDSPWAAEAGGWPLGTGQRLKAHRPSSAAITGALWVRGEGPGTGTRMSIPGCRDMFWRVVKMNLGATRAIWLPSCIPYCHLSHLLILHISLMLVDSC